MKQLYCYAIVHWLIGLLDKKKDLILSCTQLKFDLHTIHATLYLIIFYKVYITAALNCCKIPSQLFRLFEQKYGYWLILHKLTNLVTLELFDVIFAQFRYDLQLQTINFQLAVMHSNQNLF